MSSSAGSPKERAGEAVSANASAESTGPAAPVKNGSAAESRAAGDEEDAGSGSDLFDDEEEDGQKGGRADKEEAASRPKRSRVNDEEDEEEDDAVKPVARRQRKAGIESDEDEAGSLGNRSSARSSPEPSRRQASAADSRASSVVDPAREALEYREDEDSNVPEDEGKEETVASLLLPQYSVRRRREHWIAKLPNFLEINSDAYDEHLWDPQEAETSGQGRIVDAGLRSLMKTNNTIRWRRSGEDTSNGSTTLESNARIVQWSDGSMSLQIGSELFDIGSHLEASAASSVIANADAAASSIGADISQSQLSQSIDKKPAANGIKQKTKRLPSDTVEPDPESTALTYLTTPYKEAGVLSIEVPVAGTLSFKPSDMNSETHRKLAQAVKHHRVAKVTADIGPDKDPELMMEEQDKRLKEIERKKARERKKQEEKFEDDAFVGLKRRGGKSLRAGSYSGDEAGGRSGPVSRGGARQDRSDEYEQDDFVVSSPARKNGVEGDGSDEDDDGGGSDMDVDDEPDEMEKMEAQIEAQEKARKEAHQRAKAQPDATNDAASGNQHEGVDAEPTQTVRKKLVVADDEDE